MTLKEALKRAAVYAGEDMSDFEGFLASLEQSGFVIVPQTPTDAMTSALADAVIGRWRDGGILLQDLREAIAIAIAARPKIGD